MKTDLIIRLEKDRTFSLVRRELIGGDYYYKKILCKLDYETSADLCSKTIWTSEADLDKQIEDRKIEDLIEKLKNNNPEILRKAVQEMDQEKQ